MFPGISCLLSVLPPLCKEVQAINADRISHASVSGWAEALGTCCALTWVCLEGETWKPHKGSVSLETQTKTNSQNLSLHPYVYTVTYRGGM